MYNASIVEIFCLPNIQQWNMETLVLYEDQFYTKQVMMSNRKLGLLGACAYYVKW